jgi:GT2 family glycosyltransferase
MDGRGTGYAPASLSASVVVYRPDLDQLEQTLASFVQAASAARGAGLLGGVSLTVIDNGSPDPAALDLVVEHLGRGVEWLTWSVVRGQGNIGYGRGHNLAIRSTSTDHHLVLNPDVLLDRDALAAAIGFLEREPSICLVAPDVRGPAGERQYLCRRYPDLLTLFLRGFTPAPVRRWFAGRLARYEMRDAIGDAVVYDVPLASGCFMYARTAALQDAGGFSDAYFLYFEDYDLSLRLARHARLAYVPAVRIAHFGGGAALKGSMHVRLFVASGVRFFRTHGWRWW